MTSSEQSEQFETSGRGALAPGEGAESIPDTVSSLIQTATMEFHASLHLLADRARFVTGARGVAIALDEDGEFIYCASSGKSVPGCGAAVDLGKPNLSACIETRRVARNSNLIAVPVIRQEKVAGFFELADIHGSAHKNAQDNDQNEDDEIEAVSRLAEMVNTALDHLEAAEHAESRLFEPKLKNESAAALALGTTAGSTPKITPKNTPVFLPTREITPNSSASEAVNLGPAPASSVHACKSCGFPVSHRRVLCVDCEEHPERVTVNPGEGLFQIEQRESWLSTYGYTIASLLITALVAAIFFWLR